MLSVLMVEVMEAIWIVNSRSGDGDVHCGGSSSDGVVGGGSCVGGVVVVGGGGGGVWRRQRQPGVRQAPRPQVIKVIMCRKVMQLAPVIAPV